MTPDVNKSMGSYGMGRRESHEVGFKAAQTLYYVERHAERIGLPLNISITLNLSLLGIGPEEATAVFGKLRKQRFSPWIRRTAKRKSARPTPATYSYGFENVRDGKAISRLTDPQNVHVHWAVHVPPAYAHAFKGKLHDWVTEIAGTTDWPAHALMSKEVTRAGDVATYPIKGARPAVADRFGVRETRVAPQGIIIGARTGTTRNLGPTARREEDRKRGIRRRSPA